MTSKSKDWWIRDEGMDFHYPDAKSGKEAADTHFSEGDWPEMDRPYRVTVLAYRISYDSEYDTWDMQDEEYHIFTIEAKEPDCSFGKDHEWCSPIEVVGGIESNPGVYGHGGGVIIKEVCKHCGKYKIVDTWYQDSQTGEVWSDDAIWYEDADETSLQFFNLA